MITQEDISKIVLEMSENLEKNIIIIKKTFGSLNFLDDEAQTLLHVFVDHQYDEEKCYLAITSLLQAGLNPNEKDMWDYIFIQTALYAGYSEKFIIRIIDLAYRYGLDINHVDSDQETIVHTAIYSDNYLGEVIHIYQNLIQKGFDSCKTDHDGRDLVEAMISEQRRVQKYTSEQVVKFEMLFIESIERFQKKDNNSFDSELSKSMKNENFHKANNQSNIYIHQLSEVVVAELENHGIILNRKQYFSAPAVGRDQELKKLKIALALEKKNPLLVGPSGVGKTSIVDGLAYQIQNKEVPNFLQGRTIFEITAGEIVQGCSHVGDFEKKLIALLKLCLENQIILFMDEIHEIYGTGASSNNDNDMASILKHYLERTDLKVIGTTTDLEYHQYFSQTALKRRFEIISILEPDETILFQILCKVVEGYCLKNNISFKNDSWLEQIAQILVEYTSIHYRNHADLVNNPDLAISIVDSAFASAKYNDSEYIEPVHFIESLENFNRLTATAKKRMSHQFQRLNSMPPKEKNKIIEYKKKD